MSYVVAFEEEASARDVTRRYVKAFNGKTRKTRVESTKDGETWWTTAIGHFEKPFLEDRDQLEVSELTAKSAAEPMPRNIQDFKDHPVYALERHLRRNEVLHPKRVIGHVSVGKSGSKKDTLEPVYRRADVHVVRSADGWYRLGRDIKVGEQPLKRVAAASSRADAGTTDDEDLTAERPLYAIHQTEVYRPPPVVKGKIPKNAYGNLDVYVPSMVPPGAFHLKHPDAARAARTLGVDYADAVTGFEFKGRHGTAVVNGIVVATQYREAIEETLRCIQDERLQAELDRKSDESLRLWKHFLLKLRIAEKVKSYVFEGEDMEVQEERESDKDPMDFDDDGGGGGFLPEFGEEIAQTTDRAIGFAGLRSVEADEDLPESSAQGGFVLSHEAFDGGGFTPEPNLAETDAGFFQPDVVPNVIREPSIKNSRKTSDVRPRYTLIVVPDGSQDSSLSSLAVTQTAGAKEQSDGLGRVERQVPVADSSVEATGSSEVAPILVDSSTGPSSASTSLEVLSRPPPGHSQSPQHTSSDSDSNIEQRSMLSHDPDDDDAEPEWLMSD
jgi:xeroderma pigmentosum group C-complementing protein